MRKTNRKEGNALARSTVRNTTSYTISMITRYLKNINNS